MTVRRYRVTRLTNFSWSSETADHEGFVRRAADIFQDALQERYPDLDGEVCYVVIDGEPQLAFSATIYAESSVDAQRRAAYRFDRALGSSGPVGGQRRRIVPPWGAVEVDDLG
jgi:hypothetical protein